eukprot:UN00981
MTRPFPRVHRSVNLMIMDYVSIIVFRRWKMLVFRVLQIFLRMI